MYHEVNKCLMKCFNSLFNRQLFIYLVNMLLNQ